MSEDYINENVTPKSKSQIKREMNELQSLGERLVFLNNEQLGQLELPPMLLDAVQVAKKITSREGKRRQLQYIGKLMRSIDDTTGIRTFFIKLDAGSQRSVAFLHMLESWRERLLSEDVSALTEYMQEYPHLDRQYLRQLIQNAKRERCQGKPRGAGRQLFQYLKELYLAKEKDVEN